MTLALCIPAYNTAVFLPELFASVKNQAIPFDEVIIYDDGSSDNTRELASQLGASVIEGEVNRGCSFAKNEMAKRAKSDWLFFLDADDLLLPNFTERAYEWTKKIVAPDMVLMKYDYVDAATNRLLFRPEYDRAALLKDPLQFMIINKIVNSCIINKKKFVEMQGFDLDEKILFIEDRAFSVKAALAGLSFDTDVESSFIIRYFPQSMSAKKPARWLEAAINLWDKTYKTVGGKYGQELCGQLFLNAAWAAKYNEWNMVKDSIKLAKCIDNTRYPPGGIFFKTLFQIHPVYAYKIREKLLSILKSEQYTN